GHPHALHHGHACGDALRIQSRSLAPRGTGIRTEFRIAGNDWKTGTTARDQQRVVNGVCSRWSGCLAERGNYDAPNLTAPQSPGHNEGRRGSLYLIGSATMRLFSLALCMSILLFATDPAAQAQGKKEPLVGRVKNSIDLGVRYLRSAQLADGSWEVNLPTTGIQG